MTAQVHNEDLSFTVHVFKEGDVFIAHVPQLDVSSCGDTATGARRNIQVVGGRGADCAAARGDPGFHRHAGQDQAGHVADRAGKSVLGVRCRWRKQDSREDRGSKHSR